MFGQYAQILRFPGALLFSLTGLFARLQLPMASMGATLLIVHERGSYGLAAQITASYAIAGAVIAPQVSRRIDQYGQSKIVPLQLLVHVPAVLGLIFVATLQGLTPLLFVLGAVAGASQLSVGSLVRARWSKIYTGTTQLRTAFAMESLIDEIVFIIGPPLAILLAYQVAPSAALLFATLALSVGCGFLVLQRDTQPIPSGLRHGRGSISAIRLPGVAGVAAVFMFIGGVFGSFEITTIGFAEQHGVPGVTGALLAMYSIGSLIAGFAYGAINLRATLPRQFLGFALLLAVVSAPIALMTTPWLLGVAAFVAGLAVAPVLISGMSLIEHIVPSVRLTESMTWTSGGLSVGLAGGLLLSGLIVDATSASMAYLVTSGCALAAFLTAGILRRSMSSAYDAALPQPVDELVNA